MSNERDMLDDLADDDKESLLGVLQMAADHHDESKPEVRHDIRGLVGAPALGLGGIGKALLGSLLSDPEKLKAVGGWLFGKLKKKPKGAGETIHNPPTIVPPREFQPAAPPAPATQQAGQGQAGQLPGTSIESWLEEGWHDWKKGEGNDDGNFSPQADIDAGIALPPAPVVWILNGTQPGLDGVHARIPQNEPNTFFPEGRHTFRWEDEETGHSFSSNHNIDGTGQPIPHIGHVQGGPKWQTSNGWGFIIRLKGHTAPGPRTLVYTFTAAGVTGNAVLIPMSHNKG